MLRLLYYAGNALIFRNFFRNFRPLGGGAPIIYRMNIIILRVPIITGTFGRTHYQNLLARVTTIIVDGTLEERNIKLRAGDTRTRRPRVTETGSL